MLPADEHPRRPVGTRLLVAFAAERGVPPEVTLAGTGLVAAELADPDLVLDLAQELLALRNAVERMGSAPGVGAALGARFSLASHGDLGFALMTRATPREAITFGLRFLGASDALVRLSARTRGEDVVLALDATALPPALAPFAVERDVAAIVAVVGAILPGAALRIALALDEARVAAIAAVARGHAVRRGAESEILIDGAQLDRPLPNADPGTALTFERRLEAAAGRATTGTSTTNRVRAAILTALPVRTSATTVAGVLHLSPRSLRRHLEAEGTAFQAVADAALRERAQALLDQRLSVTEVAARLGYAEIASFTRAFRRWTGTTPRAYARREP